jgi:hypothetical protein
MTPSPKKLQSKYRTPSTNSVSFGSLLDSESSLKYTFKDEPLGGEFPLGPYRQRKDSPRFAHQVWLYIICALATIALLVITAVYSSESSLLIGTRFVYSSSSHTIFVLSILSGVTGLLLAATIEGSIERLQWLLIVRENGLNLAKFLSLHAGTGPMGLLSLIFGRGFSLSSSTRLWSTTRLLSMLLVPVLGILIMSMLYRNKWIGQTIY